MKQGLIGNNQDIRNAIEKRGLKHYQVADACDVSAYTFSRWLQLELPPKRKREIMRVIRSLKA